MRPSEPYFFDVSGAFTVTREWGLIFCMRRAFMNILWKKFYTALVKGQRMSKITDMIAAVYYAREHLLWSQETDGRYSVPVSNKHEKNAV